MKKMLSLLMCMALLSGVSLNAGAGSAGKQTYGLRFNNSAWKYNAEDGVYWQVGVVYCAAPETTGYESLGLFVPAAYMTAADNGDGTYTCTINAEGTVNGYTAATAPMVIPVNTPGYSAQAAPTDYANDVSGYIQAGFIYVSAGCRGRVSEYDASGNLLYNGGAPWGVTDLKAAVRYLRYNKDALPGDTDRIFTFGHSGGGAQSSLMGATGDSELYFPYLNAIGAAMKDDAGNELSDVICGAMCWCPITSLDTADEAYEWNMGQYMSTGTRTEGTWTSALSSDLAAAYAQYLNGLGLTDATGAVLTLEESESGIYSSGSYYDYLLSQIEQSLNNFLGDTAFPYTSGGNAMPSGGFPGGGQSMMGNPPEGQQGTPPSGTGMPDSQRQGTPPQGGNGDMGPGGQSAQAVTYQTAQEYIDFLNSGGAWITYDAATNTAKISSVGAFVTHLKNASKSVGAFDDLNRGQAENMVFGTAGNDALHFDATMAALLAANAEKYAAYSDWDASYVDAYQTDPTILDSLGNSSQVRQNMYNPMYYLLKAYARYGTSSVAPHWRIRTGIEQGDTALTVETNLALALQNNSGVQDVDFAMVWGQGHTMAERTGDGTGNFIQWVEECCE